MASALKIVVVEDHDVLRDAIVAMLRDRGHDAIGLVFAEDVDDTPGAASADVYVLDLNLPGEDGISLAQRVRAAYPNAGIVMMTARTEIADRVLGYRSGADIYLPKPIDPEELLAAAEALGHRVRPSEASDAFSLDAKAQVFNGPGGTVRLSRTETDLLAALAVANARTLERWQVAEYLKLDDDLGASGRMEVRLTLLRKKIAGAGADGAAIKALRGFGYRLEIPVSVV